MASTARNYDIVVMGATGFTGRLIAENLAEKYCGKIAWAIAGRNREKLEQMRDQIAAKFSKSPGSFGVLECDSLDRASVSAMVAQTRVVLSAAGPFWKVGTLLVEECAKTGVHYCDITGETPWVRELLDNGIDDTAKQSGAKIVPFCGLDSIPSDLGCFVVADEMRRKHQCGCKEVVFYIDKYRGGVSGGTIASMFNIVDRPLFQAFKVLRAIGNPYSLNPPTPKGPSTSDKSLVTFNFESRKLATPWIMAGVNSRVVRRSNALLGNHYGDKLQYWEARRVPVSVRGFAEALISMLLPLLFLFLLVPPIRNFLRKRLPAQGEGPSEADMKKANFKFSLYAKGDSSAAPVVRGSISGNYDPGYSGTAVMVSEAAVCLALDGEKLDKTGGLLTPASAMKGVLVDRLTAAGIKFAVENGDTKKNE